MAEIIALESVRKSRVTRNVEASSGRAALGKSRLGNREEAPDFPSSRPFVSGNMSDLFEHANAVATRYYDGDPKVPGIVAAKCIELLEALSDHAEPE
ncbi:hypothetical protein [Microvirga roseola]|uniref:hypothetical protein n=1 Tax=Microvirga roseola TaxID=2883126 RepID=UPI001E50C097|nr:hypothetical protein [Microvirga roseola]